MRPALAKLRRSHRGTRTSLDNGADRALGGLLDRGCETRSHARVLSAPTTEAARMLPALRCVRSMMKLRARRRPTVPFAFPLRRSWCERRATPRTENLFSCPDERNLMRETRFGPALENRESSRPVTQLCTSIIIGHSLFSHHFSSLAFCCISYTCI